MGVRCGARKVWRRAGGVRWRARAQAGASVAGLKHGQEASVAGLKDGQEASVAGLEHGQEASVAGLDHNCGGQICRRSVVAVVQLNVVAKMEARSRTAVSEKGGNTEQAAMYKKRTALGLLRFSFLRW